MMHSRTIEIWVGFFVAIGLLALFMLSMKVSNLGGFYQDDGYVVTAYFSNIGGLKVKSSVTMAGVKIGRVTDIQFDNERYEAKVSLKINKAYDKIPSDTSASIFTAGLLGEQYIGLDVGGDDVYLAQGSQLEHTQSAMVLEQLIGQFLYKSAEKGS
jgi:phospholipid/cholesterol/gamma-HCH transport system substrate-binding protein